MLFKPFKLQLPDNFRQGVEVSEPGDTEDVCACGCTVSGHSTATVRTVKRLRFPFDILRVDVRWRKCSGVVDGFGIKCRCPGFWKKS